MAGIHGLSPSHIPFVVPGEPKADLLWMAIEGDRLPVLPKRGVRLFHVEQSGVGWRKVRLEPAKTECYTCSIYR